MGTTVKQRIPELVAGDKLTRAEFLRRWEADPEIKNAELMGGIVYMPSPVSLDHGVMDGDVGSWLGAYRAATPGTDSGHNTTSFILKDTPQPDNFLCILPEYGGSSKVEDKYLGGRPELLAEICRSSASYDLHVKFDLYQAAGIPEYLAILLYEQEVRWHMLVKGRYQLLSPNRDGLLRSRIFPGLWLDSKALLARNLQQVLARLQEGLHSPEHEQFVAELASRKRPGHHEHVLRGKRDVLQSASTDVPIFRLTNPLLGQLIHQANNPWRSVEQVGGFAVGGILGVGLPEPVEAAAGQQRVGVAGVVGHVQAGADVGDVGRRGPVADPVAEHLAERIAALGERHGAVDQDVAAVADLHGVLAEAGHDQIVAIARLDGVGAVAGHHHVVAVAQLHGVVAVAECHGVVAVAQAPCRCRCRASR